MLKFKMGNYSADIPTTDDGIYVSQDEIGYDIDSVRYAKKIRTGSRLLYQKLT